MVQTTERKVESFIKKAQQQQRRTWKGGTRLSDLFISLSSIHWPIGRETSQIQQGFCQCSEEPLKFDFKDLSDRKQS